MMRKVYIKSWGAARDSAFYKKNDTTKFTLHDVDTDDVTTLNKRVIAEFPVSDAFPEDQQLELARIVQKFLNSRVEAMEKAIEHDSLLQRIVQ